MNMNVFCFICQNEFPSDGPRICPVCTAEVEGCCDYCGEEVEEGRTVCASCREFVSSQFAKMESIECQATPFCSIEDLRS